MSTIRAWSALAALLAALALGTRLLPPAATSPFLHHGTAVDRIALEGASLVLLGADGTRADLFAESLRVEHLSLDDALFTVQRGLVVHDAHLATDSGAVFRAATVELTAEGWRHRWEGPATWIDQGTERSLSGRGEVWLEGGTLRVRTLAARRLEPRRTR
jgi:hypothetical protein